MLLREHKPGCNALHNLAFRYLKHVRLMVKVLRYCASAIEFGLLFRAAGKNREIED
jgi:hypothetical protein